MSAKKKRRRTSISEYYRIILRFIDDYVAETGNTDWNMLDVARWAIAKGKADEPRQVDPAEQLARDMARAARQQFIKNDKGEPVRALHNYREMRCEKQLTFWFKIEDGTPEKMRMSIQGRRRGVVSDVLQAQRDLDYFNEHYNPGEPLEFDWDINKDVEEWREPGEYEDKPPTEEQDS